MHILQYLLNSYFIYKVYVDESQDLCIFQISRNLLNVQHVIFQIILLKNSQALYLYEYSSQNATIIFFVKIGQPTLMQFLMKIFYYRLNINLIMMDLINQLSLNYVDFSYPANVSVRILKHLKDFLIYVLMSLIVDFLLSNLIFLMRIFNLCRKH